MSHTVVAVLKFARSKLTGDIDFENVSDEGKHTCKSQCRKHEVCMSCKRSSLKLSINIHYQYYMKTSVFRVPKAGGLFVFALAFSKKV